jgi:hypothetical protein
MRMRGVKWLVAVSFAVAAGAGSAAAQDTPSPVPTATHKAVGSYFGKAIEVCAKGVAPAACTKGQPAVALFMTPTLTPDGTFLGNDSFALGGPPFGPHTTAHGHWIALNATDFEADYVFMLNAFPPQGDGAIQVLRFRWQGTVVDADTLVGYVNMYFSKSVVPDWVSLLPNEFPTIPAVVQPILVPPPTFIKDPTLCLTSDCPLVFKFTVKRVAP